MRSANCWPWTPSCIQPLTTWPRPRLKGAVAGAVGVAAGADGLPRSCRTCPRPGPDPGAGAEEPSWPRLMPQRTRSAATPRKKRKLFMAALLLDGSANLETTSRGGQGNRADDAAVHRAALRESARRYPVQKVGQK